MSFWDDFKENVQSAVDDLSNPGGDKERGFSNRFSIGGTIGKNIIGGTVGDILGAKFGKFDLGKNIDFGLGQITGRNIAKEQIARQDAAIGKEEELRKKELADEKRRAELMDRQASFNAQGIRASGQYGRFGSYGTTPFSSGSKLGADERDFLGM